MFREFESHRFRQRRYVDNTNHTDNFNVLGVDGYQRGGNYGTFLWVGSNFRKIGREVMQRIANPSL
jgi:hypothetical protein